MMATNTASNTFNHDPLLGKVVGDRYAIERLIGRGGVGLVYLANDLTDKRQVVVKVLAPHWAEDRDAVARFNREALRMAQLDHPNVVRMYDHGHFEGRTYIVMEFIRGEPLRGHLNRRKRMPFEEFAPIAAQILVGSGYVHDCGVMMRDIKPPNIMLCEQDGKANHVKMLDFGLAKLIEEDETDEVTKSHVIGTAAYMSPEQIRGDKIDVRVDVYALGVLFFLMLTGEQPIAGDNDAAILVNHVHGKPKSLAERLPKGHRVPADVIALIESCLAKEPADRPRSAGAMAKSLFEMVPAELLAQPRATAKSRAAAETYWSTRMNSGPAALAALESDTSDSAEWTRPLLRRAAKTGQAPLKLAEEELAAQQAQMNAAAPKPRKRAATGTGVKPRPRTPTGAGFSRPKPPQPPPRPPPPRPPPPQPPQRAKAPQSKTAPKTAPKTSTAPTTPVSSAPSPATVRVTAADAREAVERLEDELERKRDLAAIDAQQTGKRPTVPPGSSAGESDLVPIALDDDVPPSESSAPIQAPTQPSSPLLLGEPASGPLLAAEPSAGIPLTVEGLGSTAIPAAPADAGMRLGAIVAVAGLVALVLGGLTAFLVLGGSDEPAATPAVAAAGPADATPAATPPVVGEADAPASDVGAVEIRATNEGGSATVEVDGEDRGEAPVQLELPSGEHRVRVTAPGHHPWQTTIVIKPGANADVTAELVPAEQAEPPPTSPVDPVEPATGSSTTKKPKSGTSKPKSTTKPKSDPKPKGDSKPKGKGDVFMGSSKGKDDGIFMPVGGK